MKKRRRGEARDVKRKGGRKRRGTRKKRRISHVYFVLFGHTSD